MNLFKQRKHKGFNYTPRHLENQKVVDAQDFDPKWRETRMRQRKSSSMSWILIGLGMVIVLWFVLSDYQN